jgi:hypothetical protein
MVNMTDDELNTICRGIAHRVASSPLFDLANAWDDVGKNAMASASTDALLLSARDAFDIRRAVFKGLGERSPCPPLRETVLKLCQEAAFEAVKYVIGKESKVDNDE